MVWVHIAQTFSEANLNFTLGRLHRSWRETEHFKCRATSLPSTTLGQVFYECSGLIVPTHTQHQARVATVFHLPKTQIEWNHFRQSCDERFEQDHDDQPESDDAVVVAQCDHPALFVKSIDERQESNLHEPLQHEQRRSRQAEFHQAQELDQLAD